MAHYRQIADGVKSWQLKLKLTREWCSSSELAGAAVAGQLYRNEYRPKLMVLNHYSVFKSWQWPPKFNAHCRHYDDFATDFIGFVPIWRRSLQIAAKSVNSYVTSWLCLQCALNLGSHCHDLKTLSWFNTISGVPAAMASTVMILRLCHNLRPPTVHSMQQKRNSIPNT